MKLIEYKQYNNSQEEKKINKKKIVITLVILLLLIIISIISATYMSNSKFRNFMDTYVLCKSVKENNLPYINIDAEKNISTYAFYNYVVVLENNKLKLYNSSAKEVESLQVNISSPIFDTQGNYLVIAEKGQQKIYLIKDKKILWEKNVEGQISRINVNENGFVSVIISGTSYKSVIATYAQDGAEVFKTYLSSTLAIDVDISNDNNYLSYCEMNISGTIIESKIKTISVEKAKNDPSNSIIYTYNIPSNILVTNIEYHEKNELICMCNNKIYILKDGNIQLLSNIEESNTTFSGIKLSKSYFKVIEEISGVNNQKSNIQIYNTSNNNSYIYTINGIAKEVYSTNGVIAVNLGSEIYFLSENGMLIKKYTSNQEIKNIVISGRITGIIYRDKIEFLNL